MRMGIRGRHFSGRLFALSAKSEEDVAIERRQGLLYKRNDDLDSIDINALGNNLMLSF